MSAIINKVATKIFGSANERLLKRLWPVVAEINALEPEIERLSDDELRGRTAKFREQIDRRIAEADISGETPEDLRRALRRASSRRSCGSCAAARPRAHSACSTRRARSP